MKYYGKYKAQVMDVKDPEKLNRIRVKCPLLLGDHLSGWCVPCYPIVEDITIQVGEEYIKILAKDFKLVPRKGDYVWIEFEQGNLSKPLYVGTWR